jgi:endonuclease IV
MSIYIHMHSGIGRKLNLRMFSAAKKYNVPISGVQVFLSSPQKLTANISERVLKLRDKYPIIAHNSYVAYPWRNDGKAHYAKKIIAKSFIAAAKNGFVGYIVHLPSDPQIVKSHIIEMVTMMGENKSRTILFFEIPCSGPEWSKTVIIKRFAILLNAIQRHTIIPLGICIDTAHLWFGGANIQTYSAAKKWLKCLRGYKNICFHLNDSDSPKSTLRDIHAPLGSGCIWSAYATEPKKSGIFAFIEFAAKNRCICVLERNKGTNEKEFAILGECLRQK